MYIGPPIINHGTLLHVQGITINYESRIQILATLTKRVPGFIIHLILKLQVTMTQSVAVILLLGFYLLLTAVSRINELITFNKLK